MSPSSQRPARYSVQQLRVIADRLRTPLPKGPAVFAVLEGRRERFVLAAQVMARGYESRLPRSSNLRDLHQNIGRAFRELFSALEALRRLPPDFSQQAVAAELLAAHFTEGLAFTQRPVADLLPDAAKRVNALLLDRRLSRLSENIAHRVNTVAATVAAAPPSAGPATSGGLATAIREANLALHAYARLLTEFAGFELTDEEAEALRLELET